MNDDKRRSLAHQALSRYISDHRMRQTPERFAVLDSMLDFPSRFTIDELCSAVESGDFRVSRATIYNTVSLLADAGLARKLCLTDGSVSWEVATDKRPMTVRLVCEKCGRVRDVRDPQLAKVLGLKRYASFVATGFEVCVTGLCSRCKPRKRTDRPQGGTTAPSSH